MAFSISVWRSPARCLSVSKVSACAARNSVMESDTVLASVSAPVLIVAVHKEPLGDRAPGDEGSYPDDDLKAQLVDGKWKFVHKDGAPY